MAYTRNFGFRSFENIVRDGRFRVPRTGTPLVIGTPVTLDPDNPGLLQVADAATPPSPLCGVAIYEHIQARGVDPKLSTIYDAPYTTIPLGQYAQMVHGVGVKLWFKNTDDKLLYDGRSIEGGGLLADSVDLTTLGPGDGLRVGADGKFEASTDGTNVWMFVEQVNPSTGVVEARFGF